VLPVLEVGFRESSRARDVSGVARLVIGLSQTQDRTKLSETEQREQLRDARPLHWALAYASGALAMCGNVRSAVGQKTVYIGNACVEIDGKRCGSLGRLFQTRREERAALQGDVPAFAERPRGVARWCGSR